MTIQNHRTSTGTRVSVLITVLALSAMAALVLGACGGSDEAAAPASTPPVASPTTVPAAEPESQWDAPGSASLAQTKAVARRYAAALTDETLPTAGIYASDATWDYWPEEYHYQGAAAVEGAYEEAAAYCDWSRSHILSAPGVVAYEGILKVTADTTTSLPALALLAVDGNKVAHEEVFLDPGPESKKPVKFAATAPGPKDTAKVAAKVVAGVGEAFATGDQAALVPLLAPDILFYDTELRHGVQGGDALLAWWAKNPTVELTNQKPIAGPGWAVVRWTIRQTFPTGVEVAMPGATVAEVRDGKVVRMTLYYDSELMRLQP